MYQKARKLANISHYSSIGLIITILMLFMLSGSSAFLINIANLNLRGSKQIIQGKRGIYAALAGVEWGLAYLMQHQTCLPPTTINIDQAGIRGFTVNISCVDVSDKFILKAQAIYGNFGSLSYVNKEIEINYLKKYIL